MTKIILPEVSTENSTTKWQAVDPLEFSVMIANAAGIGQQSQNIYHNFLTQAIPSTQSIACGFLPSDLSEKVEDSRFDEDDELGSKTSNSNKKRTRKDTIAVTNPPAKDEKECFSFLVAQNPTCPTAKMAVSQLLQLSQKLESTNAVTRASYEVFLKGLIDKSTALYNSKSTTSEKSIAFTDLYSKSILHLKAIVALGLALKEEDGVTSLTSKISSDEDDEYMDDEDYLNESSNSKKVYNKKKFTKYMNQWMVKNWTNPYPDDEGLAVIADEHGTTPMIVSNWLINARTRKWRPAIVKAFEAGRPSELLLEDSTRIFEGKSLRKLK